jgi:hypothetical protein
MSYMGCCPVSRASEYVKGVLWVNEYFLSFVQRGVPVKEWRVLI